jgi:hypothetical protein
VTSPAEEERKIHLLQIFWLVTHAKKFICGESSIEFFSHKVDSAGVRPFPTYMAALVDFLPPTNIKEL